MPELAEQVLADGSRRPVSLARPLLADPEFVRKAADGRRDEINTCIACNQACLDHTFKAQLASCLVNPRAGHETELVFHANAAQKKRIAVGRCRPCRAGRGDDTRRPWPRGAPVRKRGADRRPVQHGQAHSGKEEFEETLRYFRAASR
jgi:2,4-dienoyl-CoA reductase (NADPH2)